MEHINKNNINILFQNMPSTPRISVNLFFKLNKNEAKKGIYSILARLLLQGTKTHNAIELAKEFENECIDVCFKAKQDYLKASMIFLNQDYLKAMELLKDLILNSTFEDFEKEIFKLKGEIISDLDSPRVKLSDAFIKELFQNHPYAVCNTLILESLDKIRKEDIIEAHKHILNAPKVISIVGDIKNKDELINYLDKNYEFLKNNSENCDETSDIFYNDIKKDKVVWLEKEDAQQAQILQGWLVPTFTSEDCAKITVLSNILGSSGLSSRLFVNLRDKQGLAYTVRSQYETLLHSGIFSMYIGTAPKNIKKSLEGFTIELQKLADTNPTKEEMQGARENISGRLKYFSQNNAQIASNYGYNYSMGLGLNYNELFLDNINHIKPQDVSDMAKRLLSMPKLITIICPSEYKIDI